MTTNDRPTKLTLARTIVQAYPACHVGWDINPDLEPLITVSRQLIDPDYGSEQSLIDYVSEVKQLDSHLWHLDRSVFAARVALHIAYDHAPPPNFDRNADEVFDTIVEQYGL